MRIKYRTSLLLSSALLLSATAVSGRADQDITLPAPIYLENFDELAELALPPGWTVSNTTDTVTPGDNIDDLNSDTYKNWIVVSADRLNTLKSRIFQMPSITVNGTPLDALGTGNMLYAESDVRDGNQVQYVFTSDYDLSGKDNVYAVFHSLFAQNQDDVHSLEYSIDQGTTWLPALYMVDQFADTAVDNLPFSQGDVYFDSAGNIDAVKTLNTVHGDAAQGKSYGAFIAAPITQDLAPYISGRVNDDQVESKRIEILRLLKADNQAKVRFRFMQAGTGSWYWGIDDFGIYSLPEARITIPPANAIANFNGGVTLKVVASGTPPLTYAWAHDGNPIQNQTTDTLTINGVTEADAGGYTVTVHNALGDATNDPAAVVTVISTPQIDTQPQPVWISAGASFTLTVAASGPPTLSYKWQKDTQDIPGAPDSPTYTKANAVAGDTGSYRCVVSNTHGNATSDAAAVNVLDVPITQDLVLHLPFDADSNDTSGKGNNGTPEIQPEIENGTLPTYDGGGKQLIGAGAIHITDGQDIALGSPADLQFGPDTNFTISFWVEGADANAWTGDPSFIGNKNWTSGGTAGYVVAAQGGGAWKWNWRAADHDRRDVGLPSVTDGKWHNIIISHDRAGLASFYVDGIVRVTQTIAGDGDINSMDTYIGQDGTGRYGFNNDTGAHFKDMHLDDFGIWRRIVTAQEAASIYAHGLNHEDLTKASGAPVVVAPQITAQPVGQLVEPGANVTFSVTAVGTEPLTYKWKKGTTTLSETSATLTLNNVDASASGTYTVEVSNAADTVVSNGARLLVSTAAPADGLVVHLKFDGDYSDSSGHNNNATAKGAPTLEAGKFGQAMHFTTDNTGGDYVFNYASLGTPDDLNVSSNIDFTVSFWVNYTASADDLPYISNKDWNASANVGWGTFSQGGGNFRVNTTGTGGTKVDYKPSTTVRDGTWHNIIVSQFRGGPVASYVDGVLVTTAPDTTTGSIDTGMPTNIGQDGTGGYTDNGSVHMSGLIDDVGIWRRALTASDVAAITAAANAGHDLSGLGAPAAPTDFAGTLDSSNPGQLKLSWTGGKAPFKVLYKGKVTDATWTSILTTSEHTASVPTPGDSGFMVIQSAP